MVTQAEGNDGSISQPSQVWKQYQDRPFNIDALKKAVKAEFPNQLQRVDASQLKVFADDQELTTVDALVAEQTAGSTVDNPLRITYPPAAGEP